MTSVGFIGTGVMGFPMVKNLLAAGHAVQVFNRTASRAEPLVEHGAQLAASAADASANVDIVITMLPDGPDVRDALLGGTGAFSAARPGTIFVDMSTISPATALELSTAASSRKLTILDAPVSGGEQGAVEGTLSVMVGGDEQAFRSVLPVLESIGKTVKLVGGSGSGQTVKAANQLIVAGALELLSEALVFLEAYDVDRNVAVELLAGGLAGSTVIDRKSAQMLRHDFAPGFRVDLHHKDLGIAVSAARAAGVALPLGVHVAELMASLRVQGHGDLDHSALLLQVEALSGRALDEHRRE